LTKKKCFITSKPEGRQEGQERQEVEEGRHREDSLDRFRQFFCNLTTYDRRPEENQNVLLKREKLVEFIRTI
jgi:hypothetical protein